MQFFLLYSIVSHVRNHFLNLVYSFRTIAYCFIYCFLRIECLSFLCSSALYARLSCTSFSIVLDQIFRGKGANGFRGQLLWEKANKARHRKSLTGTSEERSATVRTLKVPTRSFIGHLQLSLLKLNESKIFKLHLLFNFSTNKVYVNIAKEPLEMLKL